MKLYEVFENKQSVVTFCWGRFQPPHLAHGELFRTLEKHGSKGFWICASQTVGPKDPLDFATKMSFVKQQFPRYASHILEDNSVRTVFHAVTAIYNKYSSEEAANINLAFVADPGRVESFLPGFKKFNGVAGNHGYYKFSDISGITTNRNADSETDSSVSDPNQDISALNPANISGSLVRNLAKTNQFDKFKLTVSKTGTEPWVKDMYFALGGKDLS